MFARRATLSRLARIAREKEAALREREQFALPPRDATHEATKARVQRQIEKCDELLETCKEPELFVKLTQAKERLWNLIYPKAGSIRPGKPKDRMPAPLQVVPLSIQPIDPTAPIVATSPG